MKIILKIVSVLLISTTWICGADVSTPACVSAFTGSIKKMTEQAELGNTLAQYNLGLKYIQGIGVVQNFSKGFSLLHKAAKGGYAEAQFHIGWMYYYGKKEGIAVKQNYKLAYKWFHKAAKQGHAIAQYNVGKMLYAGIGVLVNKKRAIEWYEKSVEQHYAEAQNELAKAHSSGIVLPQNFALATPLFHKAANQGIAESRYRLGLTYQLGLNGTVDMKQSFHFYKLAAQDKFKAAHFELGMLYLEGYEIVHYVETKYIENKKHTESVEYDTELISHTELIIPKDHELAKKSFFKGANQGDPRAQTELGKLHLKNKDIKKAKEWLRKAAAQSYEEAKEWLSELKRNKDLVPSAP